MILRKYQSKINFLYKTIHNIEYTKGGEIDFLLPNITFSEYKKKIKKRNKK